MNVFELRNRLITDYRNYVQSFIRIRDARIGDYVARNLDQGVLWPDPLTQLNPSFESGDTIDELVEEGILHEECARIFRKDKDDPSANGYGRPLRLHRHQSDAVRLARQGHSFVLTTGTGSGKSLAYVIPIVDHVLRHGSGRGTQAVIVYPMNALANSQLNELRKFLREGYPEGREPVTFDKYTGQETEEEKETIKKNPPDILLTNYVMLELILTRVGDDELVRAARGLAFLVLDELHTYRGRQGADVALLVRRVKNLLEAENLQCVGTSATMAGVGSTAEQHVQVAGVASRLFGSELKPEHVVGETLRRATPEPDLSDPEFVRTLRARVSDPETLPQDYDTFVRDPLSSWIESTFGVTREDGSGRLVRSKPRAITGPGGAAEDLARLTGVEAAVCASAIQHTLLAGYRCTDPATGFPAFAFRLHQFISRGDRVYATAEPEDERHVSLEGQCFVPGDRDRVLLPLVFCRECGQEYYCVRSERSDDYNTRRFRPRELRDVVSGDESAGFLYISSTRPWPEDPEEIISRLPEEWLEDVGGRLRVRRHLQKSCPEQVVVSPRAEEAEHGVCAWFVKAPFRFCLNCGVSYGRSDDFGKLATLTSEGRSTATTILSLSTIRYLREDKTLAARARKLLSFTDNRQDASLQAGHLNDFVEIALLRSALYRAVEGAGSDGLRHDELTKRVFDALDLPLHHYSESAADVRFRALEETQRAPGAGPSPNPNPLEPYNPTTLQPLNPIPLEPFVWIDGRRAVLRAELDAYYAALYGLNRKQLRYILDPHGLSKRELEDILDPWEEPTCSGPHLLPAEPALDFHGETFRVLKTNEEKQFGEYRTRRLVLEAWERLHADGLMPEGYNRRGETE